MQLPQALCNIHLLPVEPHREAHWDRAELVLRHMQTDPASVRDIRTTMNRCIRSGGWLLVLNAHSSPAAIAALLEQLNAKEYTLRGPEVTFRLILAMPAEAVQRLHANVLRQCVNVTLAPPGSMRAAIAAMMQVLAHPVSKRYVSLFSRASDIELANHVLANALLVCGVNQSVANGVLPQLASPVGVWDFLASCRLIRQALADAHAKDDATLDYARLHEVLAHEVLLPALPSSRLGRYAGWALQRLMGPNILGLTYPAHALVDPDAEPGNEAVATMPLNVRLPTMLDYLASLYGVETVLQPPHSSAYTLQARAASLGVSLALHRLAAAPDPVTPARLVVLPEEHLQVAPLALQVTAAERVAQTKPRRAKSPTAELFKQLLESRPTTQSSMGASRASTPAPGSPPTAAGPNLQVLVLDGADSGTGTASAVGTPHRSAPPAQPAPGPRLSFSGMLLMQRLGPADRPCSTGGGGGSRAASPIPAPGTLLGYTPTPLTFIAQEPRSSSPVPPTPPPKPATAGPDGPLGPRLGALLPRPSTANLQPLAATVPGCGSRAITPGPLQQQLAAMFAAAGPTLLPSSWAAALPSMLASVGVAPSTHASRPGTTASAVPQPAGPAAATVRLGTASHVRAGSAAVPALKMLMASTAPGPAPELAVLDVWSNAVLGPLVDTLQRIEALLRGLRLTLEARLEAGVSLVVLSTALSGLSTTPEQGSRAAAARGGAAAAGAAGPGAAGVTSVTPQAAQRAPQTLSVNLSGLFAELWGAEVRLLHDTLCNALCSVEQLMAAVSEPALHDSPGVRQLLRYLIAGFVPAGWRLPPLSDHPCAGGSSSAAGGGGSGARRGACGPGGASGQLTRELLDLCTGSSRSASATTLEQWEYDIRTRVRQLQEVTTGDVDLRPTAVDMSRLARPAALLAVLVRAFAYEQNTHPANVVCRISITPPPDMPPVGANGPGAGSGSNASAGMPASSNGNPSLGMGPGCGSGMLSGQLGAAASGGLPGAAGSGSGPAPSRLGPLAQLRASSMTAALAAGAYPVTAPRTMGLLGLHARDLELPLLGLEALGLGLGAGLGAAVAAEDGGPGPLGHGGASAASGGGAEEAHQTFSFAAGGGGGVGGSSTGSSAGGAGRAGGEAEVARGVEGSGKSATAAAAAVASMQQAVEQQLQQRQAVAQEAQLAVLQPCPVVYAVPGYADPAARKAAGGRLAAKPGGRAGGNSRAAAVSAAVMAGLPASALPPPSVAVPLALSPEQGLLCEDPYRVAWECRPNSVAAEAPPERLPVLAVGRGGVGQLAGDRGAVLRLGAASAAAGGGGGLGGGKAA